METQRPDYVLITAAHNEEEHIERTIHSVVRQQELPLKWIIVSDASSDKTDDIVSKYTSEHPFIQLVRLEANHRRNFGAKVQAINSGYECLKALEYEFIGILDADLSFEPGYYQALLEFLSERPQIGITGGFVFESRNGVFCNRPNNREFSVAGATQFFRRTCFEAIGGIKLLRHGGEDWCAEVSARMEGWEVKVCPEMRVYHHRPPDLGGNLLERRFAEGRMDYSMGCLPAFQIVKCILRIVNRPLLVGALARFAGFAWSYVTETERPVSRAFVEHLRSEQKRRMLKLVLNTPPRDVKSGA